MPKAEVRLFWNNFIRKNILIEEIDSLIERAVSPESFALVKENFKRNEHLQKLFPEAFKVSLILDTNVIISDILWMVKKQKNPEALPKLLQAIACGTIKAYAPTFLIEELNKHLPRLADEHSIPYEVFESKWKEFEPFIELIEVDDPTEEEIEAAQDPKDLPYIKLQQKIGARIYSNDTDIVAMDGQVVGRVAINALRDYSCDAAVEYTIKFMGIYSLVITQKTIEAAATFLKMASGQIQKLPPWALGIGAFALIFAACHPKTKRALLSWNKSFSSKDISAAAYQFFEICLLLAYKHNQARDNAAVALNRAHMEMEATGA